MDIYSKFDVIVSDSGGAGRERRGGCVEYGEGTEGGSSVSDASML